MLVESNAHRQVIIQRLNALGLEGELFCEKLAEHKCLMAGSFPLQCLLNECYPESDIDVFVSVPAKPDDEDKRLRHGFQFHEFEQWLYDEYHIKAEAGLYYIKDVLCSRKYQMKNVCLNVTRVN